MNRVILIDLYPPWATCCICGADTPSRWGVPIDEETALIASSDFVGEWGAKPACQSCHDRHAAGEFVGTDPRY